MTDAENTEGTEEWEVIVVGRETEETTRKAKNKTPQSAQNHKR
jgi:hypothetical protein